MLCLALPCPALPCPGRASTTLPSFHDLDAAILRSLTPCVALLRCSKRNRDVLLRYKAVPALVRCLETTVKDPDKEDSDKAASTTKIDSDKTQAWVIQR